MKVKITKIGVAEEPKFPTADKKDYVPGESNGEVSVPMDYWVVGELQFPIEVGSSILALRSERNGVKCAGIFRSSVVEKFENNIAETANSKYQVEYLDIKEEKKD